MPGCTNEAMITCQGDVRFCPTMDGHKAWTGCGRALCSQHAKYIDLAIPGGRIIACDTPECAEEAKKQMWTWWCAFPICCECIVCPMYCCGKGFIEKGQRYRGPQS
jgi:hypothetical protein